MAPFRTAAGRLIQRRGLQCSFSSVFHLRSGGMGNEDAKFIENMFLGSVGAPLAFLGAAGLVAYTTKK
eukprot:CAMPEP_0178916648 /NCGR_PEP_ID=MMETSP0786-20121207/12773_1 /TAXON_ID=186022 /ORGANISM="Thalassionema frauenfeldii, Strain CCMP 1798" /LENGTH=67 /DNA_ID=CAMNT_0020590041 /DNA_START=64 /DNA_END=267 /DNA_ORIENTATION=+